MDWRNRTALVTGGASFIGSHLVDALIERGARVRVIDNLSSGQLANIQAQIDRGTLEFIHADLRQPNVARRVIEGASVVFHLAADHGGRGYVDLHQAPCAGNLLLDALVFQACLDAKVDKVVFASSGCVYPNYLQGNSNELLYLTKDLVKPPYDADNMYGWAKLMGELTLQANAREYGLKSATCRYFRGYGERGLENHAVIAMIARAFVRQEPFEVWGTGEQIRNWMYVGDIVRGTLLAAEKIEDGTPIDLGTMERTRVIDAVHDVLRYTRQTAQIQLCPAMPSGPINRVADNNRAKELLGWEPQLKFIDGLHRTIDWYFATRDRDHVRSSLPRLLAGRQADLAATPGE
jgi:nucleoside-diphosphate-sugar epimerase